MARPTASYQHEFKGFSPFLENICPQDTLAFPLQPACVRGSLMISASWRSALWQNDPAGMEFRRPKAFSVRREMAGYVADRISFAGLIYSSTM
jgi:hypothetical protein